MVCVAKTFLLIISDRIRYLTMTDATRIWMPDTFFRNEKIGAFHTILQPNLYIRIFPDGTVLYSIRQGEDQGVSQSETRSVAEFPSLPPALWT